MVKPMHNKELTLIETGGVSRYQECVQVGVPFAKGELPGPAGLALASRKGIIQPLQTTVLKQWHDGSIKWLQLDFKATVPADGVSHCYLLNHQEQPPAADQPVQITRSADNWQVATGAATFFIDTQLFRPFCRVVIDGREILLPDSPCCILDLDGIGRVQPVVTSIRIESEGPVRTTLRIEGNFSSNDGRSPVYVCRLHFFANSSRVMLELTLANRQPAEHPGGFWDLGDPGSLLFREFTLELPFQKGFADTISCSPAQGAPTCSTADAGDTLAIYQESSGGKNWRSPIHRNRNGQVPFSMPGFSVTIGDQQVQTGERATPVFWSGSNNKGLAVVLPDFWQEFPKAIEADQGGLHISLFPARFPDLHELQGGEQKTTTIYLDFATTPSGLEWARAPLTVVASHEVFQGSTVIADLPSSASQDKGLCAPEPELLAAKREVTDEFGWRNFGEIPADHEAFYHQGTETFISHYNNQYDLCGSMYRRFFATANPLWGELARDLARHLLDIDIYHTEEDREEYNNGLFWHTNHYVSAGLSTHRSFSREHLQDPDAHACGGGPGAEHCYTTGLLLHYFMTGNSDYRDAVIKLAQWCVRSLTGSQTLLATIRKAGRYVKQLNQSSDGPRPIFPRYPLTRGTGNAITACLDAFEAGGGIWFQEQSESLIRGSLHPGDDIAARNLLHPEDAWSYTVLLVAVAKYLTAKRDLDQLDDQFCYARNCLLAYAEWMLQHEYPYLEKPELIEYPNETWPAQDLRKSVILFHASCHAAADKQQAFLEKARFFFRAAQNELMRHPTRSFTRPIALILQNDWVASRLDQQIPACPVAPFPAAVSGNPTPVLNLQQVTGRIATELWQSLQRFSLQSEINWLQLRLKNRRHQS